MAAPPTAPHQHPTSTPPAAPPTAPPAAPPVASPRQKKRYYYYIHATYKRYYLFSICSSSLSLLTCSCVSILILQWLSSPHILTQHGLSHDILQCDKNENGFKADSDNPISLYVYIIT